MSNYYNDQWRLPNNENKDKQSNYSMNFDSASSDYIDVGNITELNNLSAISTSIWFKTSNVSTAPIILNGGSSITNKFYLQLLTNGTTIRYVIGSSVIDTSVSNVADGNWHHIATTQNGTSLDIYLDGAKQNTSTITVVSPSTNIGDNFKIGRYFLSAANYFDGQIDAVSIFNYELSSSQVTTLYGSSSTGIGNPMSLSPKPVFYAPLGDQDAFNGSNYLVPNSSLKDYVFDFDGSNDYIDVGNDSSLNPTSQLTLSVWVKKIGSSTGTAPAVYSSSKSSSNNGGFLIIFNPTSSKFEFYVDTTGLGGWISIQNNINIVANQWYNVVSTWDGSNIKMYIDGVLQTNTASVTQIVYSTDTSATIGKYATSYFNGKISNVQFFNTALPATGSNSVETLYNNGSPLTSMSGFTSLVSWWKLDASDTYDSSTGNWTIEDHAGSNDGISSGMTQSALQQSDLSFTSGYSPFALDFDAASSDYISAPVSYLNSATVCSISFWGKKDASNKILCIGGLISNSQGIWLMWYSDGNIYFSPRGTGGSNFALTHAQSYDNNWHHYVGVYDGSSAANCKLYLDGNLVATGSGTPPASLPATTGDNFQIGALTASSIYSDGQISNCSIWNTALTSAQVTEIYSEGVPQNLLNHSAVSSLVSWWQLGSNSSFNTNWTVLDEVTASGNNGESVNMTEASIVDGVGSSANGVSTGMGGDEVIGDAPYSTANALSVNMDVEDRVTDTPS